MEEGEARQGRKEGGKERNREGGVEEGGGVEDKGAAAIKGLQSDDGGCSIIRQRSNVGGT